MKNILRAENIAFDNHLETQLKAQCFSLNTGEALVVYGANGSGKSTLLKLLARLISPTSGVLHWDRNWAPREAFLANTLFIGHQNALHPDLDAFSNLCFLSALRGAALGAYTKAFAALSLHNVGQKPIRALSAGQQRKVALAQLWYSRATLWLLDEPFANLDALATHALKAQMGYHLQAGGALVLTSPNEGLGALNFVANALHV